MDARPTILESARALVERELPDASTTAQVAAGAEQLCARLYRDIGRWVGLDGCDALLARAWDEVSATRPWLDGVRSRPRRSPHLDGLDTGFHQQEPVVAAEALVALVAVFIELLGVAIGLELAQRLVENAWRADRARPREQEKKRHDW